MPKKKQENQTELSDSEKPQKERKVKVIYYDDGSTIADMSGTYKYGKKPERQRSTLREKFRTFFAVMKKMVLPMLCTLAAFTLLYLFFLAITGNLW